MASIHSQITNKRNFYQGGKITSQNRDFWNSNSPFEVTATPDRDTMRGRSRWLSANNPIMSNIDEAIINNVIGSGIGLQSKTTVKKLDDTIERRWKAWCKVCDLTGRIVFNDMQKMVLLNRMIDGEIFIYKKIVNRELRLQIIEADSIDSSQGENGITLDANGKPTFYNFIDANYKTYKIKAEYIINYFKMERITQYRGVSEYKQAIIDIKNFSAYQSATVSSARANAEIAYTVETERKPNDFQVNDSTGEDLEEINGLMVYYLRAGEKVEKHDNKPQGSGYSDFITTTVRMIANARKISYELAFRDYSKVNFASSRASLIEDNKGFDNYQAHLVEYFLDDIYETWLENEIANKSVPISAAKWSKDSSKFMLHRWSFPKRQWVDPLKSAKATELSIKMNQTTESAECASAGEDYEEVLQTKQKEKEMRKTYGVPNEADLREIELLNIQKTLENTTKKEKNNATDDE